MLAEWSDRKLFALARDDEFKTLFTTYTTVLCFHSQELYMKRTGYLVDDSRFWNQLKTAVFEDTYVSIWKRIGLQHLSDVLREAGFTMALQRAISRLDDWVAYENMLYASNEQLIGMLTDSDTWARLGDVMTSHMKDVWEEASHMTHPNAKVHRMFQVALWIDDGINDLWTAIEAVTKRERHQFNIHVRELTRYHVQSIAYDEALGAALSTPYNWEGVMVQFKNYVRYMYGNSGACMAVQYAFRRKDRDVQTLFTTAYDYDYAWPALVASIHASKLPDVISAFEAAYRHVLALD